jgi:hypothetical protein
MIAGLKEQRNCIIFLTLRKEFPRLTKCLKRPFITTPCVEHKSLNGINVSNVAKLWGF